MEVTQKVFVPKVRMADPVFAGDQQATLEEACTLRTASKFTQALEMLQALHDKQPSESQVARIWLST